MAGVGLIEALRRSGLSKRAAWDLEARGFLGPVARDRGHRRYCAAQVELLERIGVLHGAIGLRLDEAAAVALDEQALVPPLTSERLRQLTARSVADIERRLRALLLLSGAVLRRDN